MTAAGAPRIKVCGLTRRQDVDACLELGVDALGFNLARGPRRITPELAAELCAGLPPFVSAVALVMDQDAAAIDALLAAAPFTAIQLHGAEEPELARRLARRLPVLKACRAHDGSASAWLDLPGITPLIDAPAPAGIGGGTGEAWDYAQVAPLARRQRLVLAGGLNPGNVAAAVRAVRPWAVDTASGVESAPGLKDRARLADFIAAARSA